MDRAATHQTFREATNCSNCGLPLVKGANAFAFDGTGVGPQFTIMFLEIFVLLGVIALYEWRDIQKEAGATARSVADDGDGGGGNVGLQKAAVEASHVAKSFAGKKEKGQTGGKRGPLGCMQPPRKQVLTDFCLRVGVGELVGLLGPNGAGKSTAFKIIAGEHGAENGDVSFSGRSVSTAAGREERSKWLYMAQQHNDGTLNGVASVR